jgi:hypothetical protein
MLKNSVRRKAHRKQETCPAPGCFDEGRSSFLLSVRKRANQISPIMGAQNAPMPSKIWLLFCALAAD